MRKCISLIVLFAALAGIIPSTNAATNIFHVTGGDGFNYTINGASDPALTLVRGFVYEFRITVSFTHPFFIRTTSNVNYNEGITGSQGETSGSIFFDVPLTAPDELKYVCGNHAGMTGPLHIVDPPAITITDFFPDIDVFLASTGTDTLNLNVQFTTNLVEGAWLDTDIIFNQYLNGTNSTFVVTPSGEFVAFRVVQGFF